SLCSGTLVPSLSYNVCWTWPVFRQRKENATATAKANRQLLDRLSPAALPPTPLSAQDGHHLRGRQIGCALLHHRRLGLGADGGRERARDRARLPQRRRFLR